MTWRMSPRAREVIAIACRDETYFLARDLTAAKAENARLAAIVQRVEALADSLVWRRPERSPCGPDFSACCGSEANCDAMRPSVKVVGEAQIREALEGADG